MRSCRPRVPWPGTESGRTPGTVKVLASDLSVRTQAVLVGDLAWTFCVKITKQYGLDPHRPVICQVSRFDPWKDPVGVIEAYRMVREDVSDAQLVLAGSMASD